MKTTFLKSISIVISLLILLSCSKEKNVKPENSVGIASLNLNGEPLEFEAFAKKSFGDDSTYALAFYYYTGEHVLRKQLAISFILNNRQKQTLLKMDPVDKSTPRASFSTRLDDGDVAGNYYFLTEEDTLQDFLQFTHFDKTSGEVKGRFEASFVVDSTFNFDASSPDTILITDGYFETVLSE